MTYHFAYITFDWNYEHSYNLLQGMQKYVHENKNIKFTVFNALAKYIDQQVDVSALEILHLPTLSRKSRIAFERPPIHRKQGKSTQHSSCFHQLSIILCL